MGDEQHNGCIKTGQVTQTRTIIQAEEHTPRNTSMLQAKNVPFFFFLVKKNML